MNNAKSEWLPKQRPDRTFGLKETDNIRSFLDHPWTSTKIRDRVETTPFKRHLKALHFPFLIIEAKSGTAQESFADIQMQTALPLRSLLDLQSGLSTHAKANAPRLTPFVWFLGYKGSDWKIYACYIHIDVKRGGIVYVSL